MATALQKITWGILRYTATGASVRRLNVSCRRHQPEPDAPHFFIANHAHLSDPFLAGYFMKSPVSYVSNTDGITLGQRVGSKLVGVIPRKKGQPDRESLKKTIDTIKAGHSVGIFPEGDRCWDGETVPIIESTGSLIKKLRVPLVLGRFSGNYLSHPRWAAYPRTGKVQIDFYTITADQIAEMSRDELNGEINRLIYNNDIKNGSGGGTEFRGRSLAEGVQYLLWLCPECGKSDTVEGRGDEICCTSCGQRWNLNGNLGISPAADFGEDLKDWSDWQKKQIRAIVESGTEILTESSNLRIGRRTDGRIDYEKNGSMSLYRDRIVFEPEDGNGNSVFPVDEVKFYIDNFNRSFEFTFRGDRIALDFQGGNSSKWQFFLGELQA